MSHLPLSTSTTTLSSSSPVFPPTSQTPTIHLEHNEHSGPDARSHCDDLRQSGSFTQTATPTGYEPKIIETEEGSEAVPKDIEPKRIELDRNLWTVPYQIKEGFMGENYQNTFTEDVGRPNSNQMSEKSCIQSQMRSDYDSAESIADSDLEDGELRKMLTLPLYRQESNAPGKPAAIPQERGVSAKRTQADRREGLMSNPSQETRASRKPVAMFSPECGTREPNQEFYFQKR